jgi:RimJ/RimL family protein N-acetyltransferase
VSPDWPVETSRLTLRPFVGADFDAIHAMRSDAEVARYLYQGPLSADEARTLLELKMATPSWGREGDWLTVAGGRARDRDHCW